MSRDRFTKMAKLLSSTLTSQNPSNTNTDTVVL